MYAGASSGGSAAGSPPPALAMHGRTSLPRPHSDGSGGGGSGGGGHGFIAADHAAAASSSPAVDGSPQRLKRGVSFKGAGAVTGGSDAAAGAPPSLFGHLAGGGGAAAAAGGSGGATVSPTGVPLVPGVGCVEVLRCVACLAESCEGRTAVLASPARG
jgi:hypothetical protein